MTLNVSLVIIPEWLDQALKANNQAMNAALDLMSLSRILSLGDVAFYAAINHYLYEKMPKALATTFKPICLHDYNTALPFVKADANGNRPNDAAVRDFFTRMAGRVMQQGAVDFNEASASKLLTTMPYKAESVDESMMQNPEFIFNVTAITEDVYGVRFRLRDRNRSYNEQLVECYDATLKHLIGEHSFEAAALTPAFEEYVRLQRLTAAQYV